MGGASSPRWTTPALTDSSIRIVGIQQSIYLPGVTETPKDTADPEGDQLRQRQRAYERRIRDLEAACPDR